MYKFHVLGCCAIFVLYLFIRVNDLTLALLLIILSARRRGCCTDSSRYKTEHVFVPTGLALG